MTICGLEFTVFYASTLFWILIEAEKVILIKSFRLKFKLPSDHRNIAYEYSRRNGEISNLDSYLKKRYHWS